MQLARYNTKTYVFSQLFMRRFSQYIAQLGLLCLLVSGVIGPVVHQWQHLAEHDLDRHTASTHEHPDYDSISDESRHAQESDLTCVLCTVTITGIEGRVSTLHTPNAFALVDCSITHDIAFSHFYFTIRGPPSIS